MLIDTFVLLLPLFVLVAGGWLFGSRWNLSQDTLLRVISDFFMPMLVFDALYRSDVSADLIVRLALAVTFITLVLAFAARGAATAMRTPWAALAMPVVFMNSGFLGIPLMDLWGGAPAMSLMIVFDQLSGIFLFTLGLFISTGGVNRRGFQAIARSPILWAVIAGFALRFGDVPVPEPLLAAFEFGGTPAPPLAAFALGCSLSGSKLRIGREVIIGCLLRFGVGFLVGYLATILFGITGLPRTIVIVAAALPAAVFSYVLPARYGAGDAAPRDIVVVSTVLAILTIPVSFYLAELL